MVYYRDFREYLNALEEHGKLTRIKREINKDTQLHPLARLQFSGLAEEQRTAFLFENVIDSNGRKYHSPVAVAALAGSSQICAIGMMCQPDEISEKLIQAELHPVAPTLVSSSPLHEEVHVGDSLLEHGGLAEFPIPIGTPGWDAAPYITAPYWVTKDPDTGVPNVGMYRAMVKSPTRTGVMFVSPTQGSCVHWRKCKERGTPLEAAIVIGGPPSLGHVASLRLPVGVGEFAVAGGIGGRPLELTRCKTVNLEVPAYAEIVIEGEFSTRELEPEAPFGEASGYISTPEIMPYFTVKGITHRRKPIWVGTISQYPPSESSKLREYGNEAIVLKHLKYDHAMPHVRAVAFVETVASRPLMVIKLTKTDPATVWRTLEAAAQRFPFSKMLVAVDEDVNQRDINSVILAICMRAQPNRDFRIVTVPPSPIKDFSLSDPNRLARGEKETQRASLVMIDATMKWPFPPLALPKKDFMDEALRIWQEEGLPRLTLKEPWWGVNLGWWSQEEEALAASATKGEHYAAGQLYSQRRRPASELYSPATSQPG